MKVVFLQWRESGESSKDGSHEEDALTHQVLSNDTSIMSLGRLLLSPSNCEKVVMWRRKLYGESFHLRTIYYKIGNRDRNAKIKNKKVEKN